MALDEADVKQLIRDMLNGKDGQLIIREAIREHFKDSESRIACKDRFETNLRQLESIPNNLRTLLVKIIDEGLKNHAGGLEETFKNMKHEHKKNLSNRKYMWAAIGTAASSFVLGLINALFPSAPQSLTDKKTLQSPPKIERPRRLEPKERTDVRPRRIP